MADPFNEIRERVSCIDAGERYGLNVRRNGFALCPWHSDSKPSLKLYGLGRGCHCFACGRSADVIGLSAELLGVDRMSAARVINRDFGLNLPLDHKATRAETTEAIKERKERKESRERYQKFIGGRKTQKRN